MNVAVPTVYIMIYGHAGDVIFTRPLIKELISRHPDVKVVVECVGSYRYLLVDLDVTLVTKEQNESLLMRASVIEKEFEPGVFVFHLISLNSLALAYACGFSYRLIVHLYNSFLKEYGLYERYQLHDKREMTFNAFPAQPHVPRAKAGGVLVENGPVFSFQSDFDLNEPLQEFAEMFPMLNFYCAAKPNFEAHNVFDVSAYNLIELSELSNTCIAFLTRCSGVNAASTTEQNKYKPRCFAGINKSTNDIWDWETEENPVVFADDKEAVIEFLSYVNTNREVLPIHIKNMEMHPHKYRARLQDYVEDTSFCHVLRSKDIVDGCVNYLKARSCFLDLYNNNKNWEIAYILADLPDGNYLDVGGRNITLLLNTTRKGIIGEKYVTYSNDYPPLQMVPIVSYIAGGVCEGLTFTDGFFHNITYLSASKYTDVPPQYKKYRIGTRDKRHVRRISIYQRVLSQHNMFIRFRIRRSLQKFAHEAARLLCAGGKLYVTFDYWETKTPGQNIFDKADVLNLIDACETNGLALTEPMNWQLGDTLDGVDYTVGMLRFRKECLTL